jgi:hypothetical protein
MAAGEAGGARDEDSHLLSSIFDVIIDVSIAD